MEALGLVAEAPSGCPVTIRCMRENRKSHTQPQFYLRAFANDGHLVSIRDGRHRRVGLKKATVERNAYAFRETCGTVDQSLERCFAEVERLAAPSHRLLRQGTMPTGVAWLSYLLFLALSFGRSRRGMRMSDVAMPLELAALLSAVPGGARNLYLDNLVHRIWPCCVWVLGQLDVRLVFLPENLRLVTADHIVGLWADHPNPSSLGLLSAPLLVHPVDRQRALWFKRPFEDWPPWLDDPYQAAANANWAMAHVATDEVLVHPDDLTNFIMWLPNGHRETPIGTLVPVARSLPLWLPYRAMPAVLAGSHVEAILARSPRSRTMAAVAQQTGNAPETILAATPTDAGRAFAALVKTPNGFGTQTGELRGPVR